MLKSPYPYFGSKNRVAPIIWKGLGQISNYVEPFAGSFSIILANPNITKIETVNDINCYICNFWRAISKDPESVANFANYPVSELDLHSRQRWLTSAVDEEFKKKFDIDPDFFDAKVAGWWIYGMGASIGNNWMEKKNLKSLPMLACAGCGIHGMTYSIYDNFKKLQERLKRVRICCGDWSRVVTPSVTYKNKGISEKDITAVVLDPPYDLKNRDKVYSNDSNIFKEVYNWAIDNGDNNRLRIVLCGYEGDYNFPATWNKYEWKADGGFSSLGNSRGKVNSGLERIWFSPACLKI